MRYSKTHVNAIIDEVVEAFQREKTAETYNFTSALELIREEHLLIDRRTSALPEYASEVVHDFMVNKLSYKDIMKKYHCSMRTLQSLLLECSESDQRVYEEMDIRRG